MKGCMRVLFMVFILAFVSACTKPVAKCTDPTDNPSHHYLMGMQALEEKKLMLRRVSLKGLIFAMKSSLLPMTALLLFQLIRPNSRVTQHLKSRD